VILTVYILDAYDGHSDEFVSDEDENPTEHGTDIFRTCPGNDRREISVSGATYGQRPKCPKMPPKKLSSMSLGVYTEHGTDIFRTCPGNDRREISVSRPKCPKMPPKMLSAMSLGVYTVHGTVVNADHSDFCEAFLKYGCNDHGIKEAKCLSAAACASLSFNGGSRICRYGGFDEWRNLRSVSEAMALKQSKSVMAWSIGTPIGYIAGVFWLALDFLPPRIILYALLW